MLGCTKAKKKPCRGKKSWGDWTRLLLLLDLDYGILIGIDLLCILIYVCNSSRL